MPFGNVVPQLAFATDLAQIQRIVRAAARSLTDADGATFVLREGEQCYYADDDAISPLWQGMRSPQADARTAGTAVPPASPAPPRARRNPMNSPSMIRAMRRFARSTLRRPAYAVRSKWLHRALFCRNEGAMPLCDRARAGERMVAVPIAAALVAAIRCSSCRSRCARH